MQRSLRAPRPALRCAGSSPELQVALDLMRSARGNSAAGAGLGDYLSGRAWLAPQALHRAGAALVLPSTSRSSPETLHAAAAMPEEEPDRIAPGRARRHITIK